MSSSGLSLLYFECAANPHGHDRLISNLDQLQDQLHITTYINST